MSKKRITQYHHLIYPSPTHPEQEETVKIFKGEHQIVEMMKRYSRKNLSQGFIKCLRFFIVLNQDRALDLENIKEIE